MTRSPIIGVMGGGSSTQSDLRDASRLGELIAKEGWILLNGGRNSGVMEASAKGAGNAGGLTVGILPDDSAKRASRYIQIPIITGMGSARNNINVLSSTVVVACPGGTGTISEVALALKGGKTVILLNFDISKIFADYVSKKVLHTARSPDAVIRIIKEFLAEHL